MELNDKLDIRDEAPMNKGKTPKSRQTKITPPIGPTIAPALPAQEGG